MGLWNRFTGSIFSINAQNMKPVVSIATPCHESWEVMTPEEQGRYCGQCCKVVVDFTSMSNDEITAYLSARTEQKVCGRFRMEQVKEPKKRFRITFNVQRFAAAVLLAFGSFLFASCSGMKPGGVTNEVMGDVAYIPDTVKTKNNQCPGPTDTIVPEMHMLGEVMLPDTTR